MPSPWIRDIGILDTALVHGRGHVNRTHLLRTLPIHTHVLETSSSASHKVACCLCRTGYTLRQVSRADQRAHPHNLGIREMILHMAQPPPVYHQCLLGFDNHNSRRKEGRMQFLLCRFSFLPSSFCLSFLSSLLPGDYFIQLDKF